MSTTQLNERGDFSTDKRLLRISVMAFFVGVISTFLAKILLLLITLFTQIFYYGRFSFENVAPSSEHWGVFFIFVPAVGGLLIGLMARFGSEKIRGHGIPEALEAILFGKSIMQPKVAVLKPISSAISIGSGGPFGAEGPIIMTGGAAGSLIAQCFHLTAAERKTLLVAGAAAGMSAIFATPIAAVLLAVELLLFEWKPRSLVPVAIASATAALLRSHFFGVAPLFPVPAHENFSDVILLQAIVVGLIAGAFSTLLSKTLYKLEDYFSDLPIHWMWWPALGGLVVGIGGYFEPRALGVGYDIISDLLNGHLTRWQVTEILGIKAVIWLVALASGTSGGVLAPLLIFGCSLGALESFWLFSTGSPAIWALLSMGAILAGMMRSPFTAILFCFELTHDVESLLALLIASLCSYAFTVLVMKRSILTEKISRRGYDIFREYSVDPLERFQVKEVMTKNPEVIFDFTPLKQLVQEKFTTSRHRGYPVVTSENENSKVIGMIVASDLARISALEDIENLKAKDLIQRPPVMISSNETCRSAADKMAENDIGRILVVENEKLVGLITRSDLLKARFHSLKEESHRERIMARSPT